MNYRAIETVFKNDHAHWVGNGFYVKQYFPGKLGKDFLQRFSPFILMDYNEPYFFKGTPFKTGVGVHPHRGFETVTFAFAGKVAHGDSRGNEGVIGPGDVQWMTAGRGILHREFHETEYAKKDRVFHMIQLWVNLPAEHKMTEPKYQSLLRDQMGIWTSDEGSKTIVYAGNFRDAKGPASTFSPINIYKVELQRGETVTLDEPADFNTGILILSGKVRVNEDHEVNTSDFVLFENDGGTIHLRSEEDFSEIFVLSGKPLNEPVIAQGPFVMNTEDEILQANADYRNGVFGDPNF